MRKTKIICTLGPATESPAMLERLIRAGANVFRLNMSHAAPDWVRERVSHIRGAAIACGADVSVLMDLQGPSIRTGDVESIIHLKEGDRVEFRMGKAEPSLPYSVTVNYDFAGDIAVGDTILVDNGVLHMKVLSKEGSKRVIAEVVTEGRLGSRRHINLPGVKLGLPPLTPKDLTDVDLAVEVGADFVAMSFVRDASHIAALKALLQGKDSKARVVAKIEDQQAVRNLEEIIVAADAIMVARGDLGIECALEELPVIQRRTIQKCSEIGRKVIVATHMLESMIENPVPTRAEVTDVANAIYEQADAVMLSGETSVGEYPVKCVEVLDRVARRIEQEEGANYARSARLQTVKHKTARAAVDLADTLENAILVVFTHYGTMAHHAAHLRPQKAPIFAFSPNLDVCRSLNLSRAVRPFLMEFFEDPDHTIQAAMGVLRSLDLAHAGDRLIILSDVLLQTSEGGSLKVDSILIRPV